MYLVTMMGLDSCGQGRHLVSGLQLGMGISFSAPIMDSTRGGEAPKVAPPTVVEAAGGRLNNGGWRTYTHTQSKLEALTGYGLIVPVDQALRLDQQIHNQ